MTVPRGKGTETTAALRSQVQMMAGMMSPFPAWLSKRQSRLGSGRTDTDFIVDVASRRGVGDAPQGRSQRAVGQDRKCRESPISGEREAKSAGEETRIWAHSPQAPTEDTHQPSPTPGHRQLWTLGCLGTPHLVSLHLSRWKQKLRFPASLKKRCGHVTSMPPIRMHPQRHQLGGKWHAELDAMKKSLGQRQRCRHGVFTCCSGRAKFILIFKKFIL